MLPSQRPLSALGGFTTLEFVAVIGLTLLTGALCVSAYRTYAGRVQIITSVTFAADLQNRVLHAFKQTGMPPTDPRAIGMPLDAAGDQAGPYVASIDIANGRIDLRFGSAAIANLTGRTLSLTPFEAADQQVVWICGNKIPGVGLHPLGFAGGARQAVQVLTTIETRYLPPACR